MDPTDTMRRFGARVYIGTIMAEMRFEDGLIVDVWELMDFVRLDEIEP